MTIFCSVFSGALTSSFFSVFSGSSCVSVSSLVSSSISSTSSTSSNSIIDFLVNWVTSFTSRLEVSYGIASLLAPLHPVIKIIIKTNNKILLFKWLTSILMSLLYNIRQKNNVSILLIILIGKIIKFFHRETIIAMTSNLALDPPTFTMIKYYKTYQEGNNSMNQYQKIKKGEFGAWLSIIAYIVLALTKIIIAQMTHSQALRADGLNNATDVVASISILIGLKISRRPPDHNHHYGHFRAELIASLVAAFIMVTVG